ncbi:Choline transporter-like protein 4 [Oopsacas minuta]|uniref:Choline transporter-like protein n=1 Tax=Oopsacas minuta TaxID=111878 RepID=A0AAV7JXY9_9METZ|nr:Choline transporter-like protein 4 [Oopsacas minuta]
MDCCHRKSKDLPHQALGGAGTAQDLIARQTNKFKENIRSPTDAIFLVIFVLLIVLTVMVGLFAYAEGHPERLLNGIDSEGRVCGHDPGVEDKRFLYFFDLTTCAQIWRLYDPATGFDFESLFSCPTPQVCVSECPTQYDIGIRTTGVPICIPSVNTSKYEVLFNQSLELTFEEITTAFPVVNQLTEDIFNKRCAPYYVASTALGGRCIPSLVDTTYIVNNAVQLTNKSIADYPLDITSISLNDITDGTLGLALVVNLRQFIVDVLFDFHLAGPAMAITVVSTAIIGFLVIFLMRFLLWIIVPASIIICVLSLAAVTIFAYYEYAVLSGTLNVSDPITSGLDQLFMQNLEGFQYQTETWLALAIVCTVLWLILVLFVICLIPNIFQVIRVIGAASRAIWGVPESFFLPFLSWFLLVSLFALWASVAIFLPTTSELHYKILISTNITDADRTFTNLAGSMFQYVNGTECDIREFDTLHNVSGGMLVIHAQNRTITDPTISCQFSDFHATTFIIIVELYMLFMFLWLSNYVLALTQCSLAGGFAIWYFINHKLKKSVLCKCALLRGFLKAFIFHSGSLAMGSLIIAIIQFVEFVLVFLIHRLRSYADRYKIVRWILRALLCLTFCIEKFLKYVNRVVYIEIAIYGTGFFGGLQKAFKLFITSPIKFAVKDTLTILTLFLLRLSIISFSAVIAYFLIGYNSPVNTFFQQGNVLTYSLVPIIFLLFISFAMSSAFVSVYGMAIDTIFICTLEDTDRDIGKEFEVIRKSRELKEIPEDRFVKKDPETIEVKEVDTPGGKKKKN